MTKTNVYENLPQVQTKKCLQTIDKQKYAFIIFDAEPIATSGLSLNKQLQHILHDIQHKSLYTEYSIK